MSNILCVTNRTLCREDFLIRIEKIASAHPSGIILREKDLTESEYMELAINVLQICEKHSTPCILHYFTDVAKVLRCGRLHLPLNILRTLSNKDKEKFNVLGASCHCVEDAIEAQNLGCTYITAGHIFNTDCKKDLPGRGLDFLIRVCESVSIPVYAIGGVNADSLQSLLRCGAAGACVMSGAMVCEDEQKYFSDFEV